MLRADHLRAVGKPNVLMKPPAHTRASLGLTISSVLRSSWREVPDTVSNFGGEAVAATAATLLGTGCGALAWWRLRNSPLANEVDAAPLREAFRLHSLQAAVHTKNIEHILGHFNAVGLTPMVFKGWTLARLYARPGLRPYGDVDVLVDTGDEARALELIGTLSSEFRGLVDLDMRVLNRFLPDRSFAQLEARGSIETLGKASFRVLAAEDHLRLICLHQLDHGGWRPLWLCDVAAFVESLPKDFRWERVLEGNANLTDAVVALLGLAEDLLGARLPPGTPRAPVPAWFRRAVLHAWAGGFQVPPDSLFKLRQLGLRRATATLRARWPDPLTSTLHLRAPFRGIPRPFLQTVECARRAILFAGRTWRSATSSSPSADVTSGEGVRS
jgi:hypothetical protein